MGSRLVSTESEDEGFSPFVDVAINGMAAMFIFLAIYVAVVPPRPTPRLKIVTQSLPKAKWGSPYEADVAIDGGMGPYTFIFRPKLEDELIDVGFDTQTFETKTGWIHGTPMMVSAAEMRESREIEMDVRVSDQSGQSASQKLTLVIDPMDMPFDPNRDKLQFATEDHRLADAQIGRPYEAAIPLLGGIEPYDVQVEGLPAGLELVENTSRLPGVVVHEGLIRGAPEESAERKNYTLTVSVVDQQSAKVSDANRKPRLTGKFQLRVHDLLLPIEVKGLFPGGGRAGLSFEGAVVTRGGSGNFTWKEGTKPPNDKRDKSLRFPSELGLEIDKGWGILRGVLRRDLTPDGQPVQVAIPLEINGATGSIQTRVTMNILPPMRFVNPD